MFPLKKVYISRPGRISIVFEWVVAEQADAFHFLRSVFGAATDVEAQGPHRVVLHIRPGCSCEYQNQEEAA
jgi:hypothetical protein